MMPQKLRGSRIEGCDSPNESGPTRTLRYGLEKLKLEKTQSYSGCYSPLIRIIEIYQSLGSKRAKYY